MNVAIVIESFFDGGAEIFAIRLANELALTQNVFFIELYPARTSEKRQLALLNRKRIPLFQPDGISKNKGLARKISNRFAISRAKTTEDENIILDRQVVSFIKRNKITTVNSHSWDSDVYFARIRKKLGFKLISTFHGHYELLSNKRKNYDAATKNTLAMLDKVVYTSSEHEKTLDRYEFPDSKRYKIFYGISMTLCESFSSYHRGECLNIVMVARGIKEKGWEEAVLAVLNLLKKYPDSLKLNLVGEGPHLEYLKTKYNHSAIQFLGYKNDVTEVIKNAHIGILPTYYIAESLPNTVIEYLFFGKPVVTTNVGAIKEMISSHDELAGTCIDLENGMLEVDPISVAIENYITNPTLVEKQSQVAFKAAEKFTMGSCVENYINLF